MASLLAELFFFFFFFLLISTSPVSSGKCNKEDKKVLLAIKDAIGDFTGWTSQIACCDWYGVSCDETGDHRVVGLFIGSTDTYFAFPTAVADLTFLTSLTFHKNPGLTGPIPAVVGTMVRLTFLRLDWNDLSGPVPSFLGRLTDLDYLNLAFNRFSGSIPPSLGSLFLSYLAIDHNRLTGPIPGSLGHSVTVYLYLSNNNLTGGIPESFSHNNSTEVIDLSRNQLNGDATPLFGRSKPLQRLDLSRNHEIRFDMSEVEIPENMVALDLNHNRVFGSLPAEIAERQWQLLNVSYNQLCGPIPSGKELQQRVEEDSFLHNKCLCGKPLPPCK